ncbi:TniQ family protein [Pseudonocardia xinjiangensis]|uniref:TniQ family protein n=1 Tax=Pseudonocardia xinjiangensis TaxID=75289 RepID=UPI003D89D9E6
MSRASRHPFPSGPVCRLPLVDKPFRYETIKSYLRRLTMLNHLPDGELCFYLDGTDELGRDLTRFLTPTNLELLAAVTGYNPARLRHTFPVQESLISADLPFTERRRRALHPQSNPDVLPDPIPACTLCAAARQPRGAKIMQWAPQNQRVCFQHQRWIGPPGRGYGRRQVDLSRTPSIIAAARQHQRLIRRHGRDRAAMFINRSHFVAVDLDDRRIIQRTVDDRLQSLLPEGETVCLSNDDAVTAARYPVAVALATIIASPRWRTQLAAPAHIAGPALRDLTRDINAALRLRHPWTPGWKRCELTEWILELRPGTRLRDLSTLLEQNPPNPCLSEGEDS